jgi:hypothetical protein
MVRLRSRRQERSDARVERKLEAIGCNKVRPDRWVRCFSLTETPSSTTLFCFHERFTQADVSRIAVSSGVLPYVSQDVQSPNQPDAGEAWATTHLELTEHLGSVSGPDKLLRSLERALVPATADWIKAHLARPDGTLELVAAAHTDQTLTQFMLEHTNACPPEPNDPVRAVWCTGNPELITEIPDALLSAPARMPRVPHGHQQTRLRFPVQLDLLASSARSGKTVYCLCRSVKREPC